IGFSGCAEMFDFPICAPNSYGEATHLYAFNITSPKQSDLIASPNYDGNSFDSVNPGNKGNDFYFVSRDKIIHFSFHTSPAIIKSHLVPHSRDLSMSPDGNNFLHGKTTDLTYLGIVDTTAQF